MTPGFDYRDRICSRKKQKLGDAFASTSIRGGISAAHRDFSFPTAVDEAGSNITAYYRIQGPRLVIEYAPQNDEPANHVHTIYRDPTNDYGHALTMQ